MEFKRDNLETVFKEFFDEFRLNKKQFEKLKGRVKENLIQATENKSKEIALAQKQVADLKERQKALIQKNLEGVFSNDILREQLEYIETELTRLSPLIVSPVDYNKRNIEAAFKTITEYLQKPSSVWEIAPFHCQLKLQWFNFPKGVTFDGRKFRTKEICCLFNHNGARIPSLSNRVHPVGIEPTTLSLKGSCSTS